MSLREQVALVRDNRSRFDKIVINLFTGVFRRWCDRHIGVLWEKTIIDSDQLHEIDAQMKADLKFKGYGL